MAKFTSHVYADIRGSVSGTTYARNRYGIYARRRVAPVQPNTNAQKNIRALLTVLSATWRTLSEQNRDLWRAFAESVARTDSLGQNVRLSGTQAYVMWNLWRTTTGLPVLNVPPATPPLVNTLQEITLDYDPATPTLDLIFNPSPYQGAVRIFATAPLSRGIQFVAPSKYRLIATQRPAAGGGTITSPIPIYQAYTNKFGPIPPNARIHVRVDTGSYPTDLTQAGFFYKGPTASIDT